MIRKADILKENKHQAAEIRRLREQNRQQSLQLLASAIDKASGTLDQVTEQFNKVYNNG